MQHSYGVAYPWIFPPGRKLNYLTKQQEQEFIDKLTDFREHKTTSARANNAAAARDMLCTSDSINTQVSHQRAPETFVDFVMP